MGRIMNPEALVAALRQPITPEAQYEFAMLMIRLGCRGVWMPFTADELPIDG
jgi:hypothetical protein